MSLQRLVINTGALTAAGFQSVCNLDPGQLEAAINFEKYVGALCGGNHMAILDFKVGAVQASATVTATGAATAAQTIVIANVTFTARASGATGNEFNLSATPATQAANLAAAINASSSLAGIVTAVALLGVVTITSVVPGVMSNGLALVNSLTNSSIAGFSGGSDGTAYTLDLR